MIKGKIINKVNLGINANIEKTENWKYLSMEPNEILPILKMKLRNSWKKKNADQLKIILIFF
jgi:hypothetical protein